MFFSPETNSNNKKQFLRYTFLPLRWKHCPSVRSFSQVDTYITTALYHGTYSRVPRYFLEIERISYPRCLQKLSLKCLLSKSVSIITHTKSKDFKISINTSYLNEELPSLFWLIFLNVINLISMSKNVIDSCVIVMTLSENKFISILCHTKRE